MKVIFSHIPKTAGTSVRWHLDAILPQGTRISVNEAPGNIPAADWPTARVPDDWVFLTGHLRPDDILANRSIHAEDPDIAFFSVLRDPVDRLLSLYNYVRVTPDHPAHDALRDTPVEAFLRAQPANYQADWLSGLFGDGICWTTVLTDTHHLSQGLRELAAAAHVPDPDAASRMTLALNVTAAAVEHTHTAVVARADLPGALIAEVEARNDRDMALIAAVARADGALVGLKH